MAHEEVREKKEKPEKKGFRKLAKLGIAVVVTAIIAVCILIAYVYANSPEVVKLPKLEHYHFRMQILVNGKAENFGTKAYQTGYVKDLCNANLSEQPIHFHDDKDQFTHIHWEGMTGGMVMKYYGWNYIGGESDSLGYKLDDLTSIQRVTIHGDYLPGEPAKEKFYIYTGDKKAYKLRSFDDWANKDLEDFFGMTSNSPAHQINKGQETSFLDGMFPTAYAHGNEDHSTPASSETEEQKLTRINNLLGNVVIFVQDKEPTDEEIKSRFNQLEPLTDSTCGG